MLDSVTSRLNKWASLKTVLPLLVLTIVFMIVINTVNLPFSVPRIQEVSQGADILDMQIYYTKSEAYMLLEQLQPEGRHAYSMMLWGFDIAFPALYAITFSLIIKLLFRRGFPAWPVLRRLSWLPLLAGLFDWLENVSILVILLKYPALSNAAYASGLLTLGKWVLIWLSLGIVLMGGLYKLTSLMRKFFVQDPASYKKRNL